MQRAFANPFFKSLLGRPQRMFMQPQLMVRKYFTPQNFSLLLGGLYFYK